jgi:hypothetical protein
MEIEFGTSLILAIIRITLLQLCLKGNAPWYLLNRSFWVEGDYVLLVLQPVALVKEIIPQIFNII